MIFRPFAVALIATLGLSLPVYAEDCPQPQVSAAGNAFASDNQFPFLRIEYLGADGKLRTLPKGSLLPIDFVEVRYWFTERFMQRDLQDGTVAYFRVDPTTGGKAIVCPEAYL